ncbi:uncharacterized protein LOC116258567 isoform X1 [Nymphaea colorata]|nr:uncharacterized protein LOC116258567 isoform X1 [Nymphaea colorata]
MVTGRPVPLCIRLLLLLLCSASVFSSSSDLVLESGYTVETVFDGHGAHVSPFSVIPYAEGLILLDNVHSAFYRAPLPISLTSVFNHISGSGNGFVDGDLVKAMFSRPRSFTVDDNGNIYVADRANFAIRKISKSGVSTIAGGYAGRSGKSGHADGPSQNATFSNDFELIFVRKICALLISDRANDLIRQINLRSEDCLHDTHTGLGMTSTAIIIVSCVLFVLSFGAGVVAGPFITRNKDANFSKMKKHFQINLRRRTWMLCSVIKSGVANSILYMLMQQLARLCVSHLFLMIKACIGEKRRFYVDACDAASEIKEPLKDLIDFDEGIDNSCITSLESSAKHANVLPSAKGKLEQMIEASVSGFESQVENVPTAGPSGNRLLVHGTPLCLVKRMPKVDSVVM